MIFRILASLLILALSVPAFAAASRNHIFAPPPPFCLPGVVNVCGVQVGVPSMAYGDTLTLLAPFPYQHDSYTVTCAGGNSQGGSQQILDISGVTCALMQCPAMEVSLCGTASVPVEGGTFAGRTRDTVVPSDMLIDPQGGEAPFRVKCGNDGNGDAAYIVDDESRVSCNRFPCPDTAITLCGMGIPLQSGAALGEVRTLNMPPPFAPDPFTIQCVGSNAKAPQYQITDSSAVTCQKPQ